MDKRPLDCRVAQEKASIIMNELSDSDNITGHSGCSFPDLQVIG